MSRALESVSAEGVMLEWSQRNLFTRDATVGHSGLHQHQIRNHDLCSNTTLSSCDLSLSSHLTPARIRHTWTKPT